MVDVTAIIPAWNSESVLASAVESIWDQTPRPRSVIVIDDCSSDGTRALARQLGLEYGSWFVLLTTNRNSGPGSARNLAYRHSNSEFVAFLDADDRWIPGKIRFQHGWMQNHPTVAMTGHGYLTPSGVPSRHQLEGASVKVSLREQLWSNRFSTSTVMLRRSLIGHAPFEEGGRYSEDFLAWARVIAEGRAACRLPGDYTIRDKPPVPSTGLSSHLWRMELGQLSALRTLHREGLIRSDVWLAASLWSLLRFGRRGFLASRWRRH